MSDLNDELLNYELGDDIDDHALYGADEDELLLSDDELEKDVTNEVKQQLKAEAEQWVKAQMQEHPHMLCQDADATTSGQKTVLNSQYEPIAHVEVSSSATAPNAGPIVTQTDSDVSTSEESPVKNQNVEFKQPSHQQPHHHYQQHLFQPQLQPTMQFIPHEQLNSYIDEVTSSSSKELEMEHSSMISCSTGPLTDSSSLIHSSQESSTVGTAMSGEFSDPREDPDDEREERTNIKTTSERETEHMAGLSPDKNHHRFMHGKRGGNPLLRTGGPHLMRGGPFPGQRPLLRYPPHGNFPLIAHFPHLQPLPLAQPHLLSNEILPHMPATTPSSLIPGQFMPQQQPPHPYATHTPHTPAGVGGNAPPAPQSQQHNPNTQNHPHLHDPNNHPHHPPQLKMRHTFPSYRPGGPGGFRHPNPAAMYAAVPRDYNNGAGAPQFNQNYGPLHAHQHAPRPPLYRPEMPGMPPGMRLGLRMQRPPHGMPMNPGNYGNGSHMRHPQPQAPPMQMHSGVGGTGGGPPVVANAQSMPLPGNSLQPAAVRPSKVLINPNFKGGVEAATSKFIKETQFMSTISTHVSHLQSDEELLRQQEEFINKNRQHIEKRRHERSPLPPARRSRSRSRSRSYSPAKRGGGGQSSGVGIERHFERERERERERDRERDRPERIGAVGVGGAGIGERFVDRERERVGNHERVGRLGSRERERERPGSTYGGGVSSGARGNRFRRGNSRDRDYENRGASGNYGKRRRSLSPPPIRGVRRGLDRERNDVEEDEETRVYRLEIEKQKAMREKILRDKEMRRRRAAEVKLNEDKPAIPSGVPNEEHQQQHQQQQQPQKLKPIIVTESKIISLKKKQQLQRDNEDINDHHHHHHNQPHQQQQQRKQIPTAKILPEAKRTLNEHLSNVTATSSNTAVIKPVLKQEMMSSTPPTTAVVAPSAMMAPKYSRHLSSPSDDEVELDYDEDELMLDEEDRLLASPTPPPPQLPRTRTPTPEPAKQQSSSKSNNYHSSSSNMGSRNQQSNQKPFATTNRRVVLKSSSGSRREDDNNGSNTSNRNRHGGSNHRDNHSSSSRDGSGSNSRSKGIFDRLDARSKLGEPNNNKSQRKTQQQRIVMKNN